MENNQHVPAPAIGVLGYWQNIVGREGTPVLKPEQTKADCEIVRSWLLQEMMSYGERQHKEQMIRYLQKLLVKVVDKYQPVKDSGPVTLPLQQLLQFMQHFFGDYFDKAGPAPLGFQVEWKAALSGEAVRLQAKLKEWPEQDQELADLLLRHLASFYGPYASGISYESIHYQNMLVRELLDSGHTMAADSCAVLYLLNFNHPEFIRYQFLQLRKMIESLPTHKEKVAALRLEQKRLNQLSAKPGYIYTSQSQPLLEQVNAWINEEVKYWEYGFHPANGESAAEYEGKIQTSLSVAKLAVLMRLMVVDKIIINRSAAPMLRVVSKTFTTLQKDEISPGSLETKYHSPDKATVEAVRDMLFKWINILGRL